MGLTIKKPVTKNTQEAMALLWKTKRQLIIWGRQIARRLTEHGETVTGRQVREVMIAEGHYQEGSAKEHWLGKIFDTKKWECVGLDIPKEPISRGKTHTLHPVKIWRRRT